jgi:hypothetical protein
MADRIPRKAARIDLLNPVIHRADHGPIFFFHRIMEMQET